MEYRVLGDTGLSVSRIGLGTAGHGRPGLPEAHVEKVLNEALDLGINFLSSRLNQLPACGTGPAVRGKRAAAGGSAREP